MFVTGRMHCWGPLGNGVRKPVGRASERTRGDSTLHMFACNLTKLGLQNRKAATAVPRKKKRAGDFAQTVSSDNRGYLSPLPLQELK